MIAPVGNLMVNDISDDLSKETGIEQGMVITHINGRSVNSIDDLKNELKSVKTNDMIDLNTVKDGKTEVFKIEATENILNSDSGVLIESVQKGSAAEKYGLESGMTIYQINDIKIETASDLAKSFENVKPGEKTEFYVYKGDEFKKLEIIPEQRPNEPEKSFFGFVYRQGAASDDSLGFEIIEFNSHVYLEGLKKIPHIMLGEGGEGFSGKIKVIIAGIMLFMILPFFGLTGEGFSGFSGNFLNFYEPIGIAEPFGPLIFMIANVLIWTAWINFYVGLFNCLPAIPLDGGHVFESTLKEIMKKINRTGDVNSKMWAAKATKYMTMFVFGSFIFMFVWPHIGNMLL